MKAADYARQQQDKPFVGIPLMMPRLNGLMKGIDKGDWWLITAQTSCFKSSFTMAELVISTVEWVLAHAKDGIDVWVPYFLLEENRLDLEIRMLSYLFEREVGLEVSENALHGRQEKLSAEAVAYLPQMQATLDRLLSKIEIVDSVRHGYGITRYVADRMATLGRDVNGQFVYHNPNMYVLLVIDHLGDLMPSESEKTLWQAIENLTSNYLLRFKNYFRVIPLIVQQQENVGDRIETTFKGETIESRLSPATAKLADHKGTAKRATTVISLFNPATYELEAYKGYRNIKSFRDRFLYLMVHKNRRGPKNVGSGIWVNPVTKHFEEFPAPDDLSGQMTFLNQKGRDPGRQNFFPVSTL